MRLLSPVIRVRNKVGNAAFKPLPLGDSHVRGVTYNWVYSGIDGAGLGDSASPGIVFDMFKMLIGAVTAIEASVDGRSKATGGDHKGIAVE